VRVVGVDTPGPAAEARLAAAAGTIYGGYPGLAGQAWALVLPELRTRGLDTGVVALNPGIPRTTLGALLADPTPRRCPTPVGTDAWLQVLGRAGPRISTRRCGETAQPAVRLGAHRRPDHECAARRNGDDRTSATWLLAALRA
jgi:hypothetical protein